MKVTSHLHPVVRSRTYITAFSNIFSEYDADFLNTGTSLFLYLFLYLYTLSSSLTAEVSQVFYFVTFLRKFMCGTSLDKKEAMPLLCHEAI